MMNRRQWLRNAALIGAGVVAADQLELLDRLGWKRRFFPGWSPDNLYDIGASRASRFSSFYSGDIVVDAYCKEASILQGLFESRDRVSINDGHSTFRDCLVVGVSVDIPCGQATFSLAGPYVEKPIINNPVTPDGWRKEYLAGW